MRVSGWLVMIMKGHEASYIYKVLDDGAIHENGEPGPADGPRRLAGRQIIGGSTYVE